MYQIVQLDLPHKEEGEVILGLVILGLVILGLVILGLEILD
jgi:hypothetical protein